MKHCMLLIFGVSVLQCSPKIDNKIGYAKDDKYYFESRQSDSIITSWNELLIKNKLGTSIKDFTIVKGVDYGNQQEYYGLSGSTTSDSVHMVQSLLIIDHKFYFDKDYPSTVICHGVSECLPTKGFGNWSCSSKDDEVKCKKIEVVSIP